MNLITLKHIQVPQYNNPYGDKYKTDKDFCLGDIIKVGKDKYLVTNIEDMETASQEKYTCPDLNTLLPNHYTLIRDSAVCTGGEYIPGVIFFNRKEDAERAIKIMRNYINVYLRGFDRWI